MLRNFAAALLATALIAGPAMAAQPSGDAGTNAPATVNSQTVTKPIAKPFHTAKHFRAHVRRHLARRDAKRLARHYEKAHHRHFAHNGKPWAGTKGGKNT